MVFVFFVTILIVVALVLCTLAVVGYFRTKRSAQAINLKHANATLRQVETTVRRIANGSSGNESLDAQIALDVINSYYDNRKEIE